VKQLVQNTHWITPPPKKIVWCYQEWQKAYESLLESVTFVKNIPSDDEQLVADLSTLHLLIFDDMMGVKPLNLLWIGLRAKCTIEIPV
jgi:hypothetical protein